MLLLTLQMTPISYGTVSICLVSDYDIKAHVRLACRLSWVQVGGSTYHFGDVVVLKYDLLPTFGVIHDLIVFDVTEFFIVAEVLITQCFVDHYHSFEVSKQPLKEYSICPIKDLIDHHVLGLYNIADSFFVPLKYYLVENI